MSIVSRILNNVDSNSKIYQNDKEYSYRELINLSHRISNIIQNFKEQYIILKVSGSLHDIATILAIWNCGKIYVPVRVNVPEEKLKLIQDVVVNYKVISFDDEKMYVDGIECDISKSSDISKNVNNNNLMAYVIFTSGTTGIPKGVPISHKNLEELFISCEDKFSFNENDTWINFHSLSFDFSIWEIFGCLLNSSNLVLLGDTKNIELDKVSKLIIEKGVTVLNQTPSVFTALSEYLLKSKEHSIRYLIFGGEKLNCSSIKKFYNNNIETKFINMYGITEVTIHATFHEITDIDFVNERESNIGVGLQNDNVFLVNQSRNRITSGEGEIVVSGSTVSKGYLNRESLGSNAVFQAKDGVQYYYSGDLGKYNDKNEIIYIGRRDLQIAKNGYRIELGEIKDAIISSGFLKNCEMDFYNDQIICYYKSEFYDLKQQDILRLNKKLRIYIEDYKIPNRYCAVEKFSTNENGKINVKKLRMNLLTNNDISNDLTLKEWLKKKVSKYTGRDYIHVSENISFVEMGVTSLQMISIHQEISDTFKLDKPFSVIDLFEYGTINKLCNYFEIKDEKIL
ncbi:non-ribosomal peptide synthetase [Clostridium gasigenes]|uniref:non-ribosomal peptide synthetase n=1 Tax=Clostridium gasigenes TaxID=94869 RepID=UPI001C0B73B2|nr:non-ribosomal peptide synthetase [Clostridium gasigenes]MBU3134173.1 non-ribosomal peptide synthetase [Clostridium gasigenes]